LLDTTRLMRLLTILSEAGPLPLLLDRVLSALSELFSTDIVVLLDPAGTGHLSPLAAIGLPEDMIGAVFSAADGTQIAATMRTRAPVAASDSASEPALDASLRELGVRAAVSVPVTDTQVTRGALVLGRCRPAPFSNAEADLLSSMAYRIGLALEQAQHSAQLERAVAAGDEIRRHLDDAAIRTEAVRLLPAVVGADAAAFALVGPDGELRCAAQIGLPPDTGCDWPHIGKDLLSATAGLEAFTTPDVRTLPGWVGEPAGPARALLAAPLRHADGPGGLLCAIRFTTMPFTPDTAKVAMLYAGQVSAALENAHLYRVVRDELSERARAERGLRESEERLKLALTGADLGMWDWDIVTDVVSLNDRAAQILGYDPEEVGRDFASCFRLVHPGDRAPLEAAVAAHLSGSSPQLALEHRVEPQSGDTVWVLNKGRVTHRDPAGRPLRAVGTLLDVTESRQVQAERLVMERQRQQLWRAESLGRMAGGVAHHFNNLLSAVIANLELVLEDPEPSSASRDSIEDAVLSARRATEISRLMLAYLGQTSGRDAPLDLIEVARESVPLLLSLLPQGIRLTTDFADAPATVLGQRVHIQQILHNLVTNCMEAIGARPGVVTIGVRPVSPAELDELRCVPSDWKPGSLDHVCLFVRDDGAGIDAVTEQHVFDPFFSTKFTGRGLGLSVVLGLVRAQSGAIAIQSEVGRGTTFRLFFPLALADLPLRPVEPEQPVPVPQPDSVVLVVDDEPTVLRVARARLERMGYSVLMANDGAEALDVFRANCDRIGLVLLDLAMPHMDGWATLTALRAISPGIRAVLASGYEEGQVMQGDHPEQPQSFLQKPYGVDDLRHALATAFGAPAG